MNQLELMKENLLAALPSIVAEIDRPADATGSWMLDVKLGKRAATIEWIPYRGFGLSSRDDIGYGEGADEFFEDANAVIKRVQEILKLDQDTRPPESITLTGLRERLRMTQTDLADRLHVSQAVVSEIENNIWKSKLTTLLKTVEALNGRLDIRVVLEGNKSFLLDLTPTAQTQQDEHLEIQVILRGSYKSSIEGTIHRGSDAEVSLETKAAIPDQLPVYFIIKDAADDRLTEIKGKFLKQKKEKSKNIYWIQLDKKPAKRGKKPASFITADFPR